MSFAETMLKEVGEEKYTQMTNKLKVAFGPIDYHILTLDH